MSYLYGAIEIALIIFLPLILYYQRNNWDKKSYIANIVLIYIIWFFSFAVLHESCHLLGSWITGTNIQDYQLMPKYWKGDFKTAYVGSVFKNKTQLLISVTSPYIRDIIFLMIGTFLLKKQNIKNGFLIGLLFTFFISSPIYDIVNNYSFFALASRGDFSMLSSVIGNTFTHLIGLLFTSFGIIIIPKVLNNLKALRIDKLNPDQFDQ